jgi:hypothetical protein
MKQQTKIQKGTYEQTPEAFYRDFAQMIENAKIYNRKGSWVYKDAVILMVFRFDVFLSSEFGIQNRAIKRTTLRTFGADERRSLNKSHQAPLPLHLLLCLLLPPQKSLFQS